MKRKQIYLTETLEREISLLSKREDRPQSEVIRELLNYGLSKKTKEAPAKILLKIAAEAKPGPENLSVEINSYLYGKRSPNYGKRTLRRR